MTNGNAQQTAHPAPPCVMVIFGASGDLTKRKLLPALLNLAEENLLPKDFAIVGFSFDQMTTDALREKLGREVREYALRPVDDARWQWLVERIYYVQGDFGDPAAYQRLKDQILGVEKTHNTLGNRFHYLAVAPKFFSPIVKQLGQAGLTQQENGRWTHVIVEKPFGHDLDSAIQLNKELKETLNEKQIYRIDHYLGKETVQNLMVFRFANSILEPLWNRNYIDHVQITAAETVGVEHRGGFYETAGALRDMVPNHLFQLLTLTAMEPPISFEADAVRDKQAEILHAVTPPAPETILQTMVRGQYGEGSLDGEKLPAYRDEPQVAPDSHTETFVALKLCIDNWRWADVPFYLRTGKRMAKRVTEIAIQFRKPPFQLFSKTPIKDPRANRLVIHIQPEEGISLRLGAKVPGSVMKLGLVHMDFDYSRDFGTSYSTGYERLLYDCMIGDATLFQRADMVEAGWSVIQPVLDVWKALPARDFPNYPAGCWGPQEADAMMARDGRAWRDIDSDEPLTANCPARASGKAHA
ncbi:MAG: glucose-6-phosphate dehydrogenase [Acidobacteria bacterium]|nr:glucose-6-phosphate dehydrogenase [Acidobacteriota bacterium]MBS1865572.1 glucose-6-phosphate dehydrogenase [Acidobacteriota bacterium]